MADSPYIDKNGVQWRIITSESSVFATPEPSSARKYDDAPDLGPISTQGGDRPGAQQIAALKVVVEAYAGQHAKEVALEVTARRDGGAWVWLLLIVLAAMDDA